MAVPARPETDEVDRSADPREAGLRLERISRAHEGAGERIAADPGLRSAVVAVVAASPWLARVCTVEPSALDVLSNLDARADPGTGADPGSGTGLEEPGERLARVKRLEILRIAARDLMGLDSLETVGSNLADLAGRLLQLACDATGLDDRIAVIGMGKLGGGELNYSSDIDVMLVAGDGDELPETRSMLEAVREAWRVDLDLRPEGRSGPLIRSLDSYLAYWDRWAHTWEFQALLKARPVAGDARLGNRFMGEASARLWSRPFGASELREVRGMKERVEAAVSRRGLEDRELKRGRGGIRDVEFAVQLLQMVHGRSDGSLRSPSTLPGLRALAAGGYVGRDDAEALADAYVFLRTVEHRLQMQEDQQTHLIPKALPARSRLARVLGYRDSHTATAAAAFENDLHRHQATVRRIHERLFFRPLLETFTRAADGGVAAHLDPSAVEERLEAFGFADAARTSTAVRELTRGFSRTSRLMQQMLPVLLDWLSTAPDPDLGLLGLRSLAGAAPSKGELTALCRESPEAARSLCGLLGTGPRFARGFQHHPEQLADLASQSLLASGDRDELAGRLRKSIGWRSGESAVEQGLRMFVRSETLRIAARDVLGVCDVVETGLALSDLAEVVIEAALEAARPQVPLAVVGMGRLGGRELSYSSDLDILFVYEAPDAGGGESPEAAAHAAAAERAASAVVRMISGFTPALGIYRVDTALRPEGRQGPQARSVGSYAAYYRRWAEVWERQALLRGRIVAGDRGVGERYAEVAGSFVWGQPLGPSDVREIRRTKARVERERVPASEDPAFHLKLGPGALSDVEWTVQLLQLQHGVVSSGTMEGLGELVGKGALSPADAKVLSASYRFCEQTRNRLALVRDLPGDSLPTTGHLLSVLARSLGSTPAGLRDDYRRHTRRARRVVERLFYGGSGPD